MDKEILIGLRKDFVMIKAFELKPNFSFLAEKYGIDSRTVKKYYEGYEGKPSTRDKTSKLDKYYEIIKEKLSLPGVKLSALYFFLTQEKGYDGSYSSLTYYVRKHPELRTTKTNEVSHVRYETGIGEQLQFDWVESIEMISKFGKTFEFNVFSAELCYSRFHFFGYSKFKTREDVFLQLIKTFKFFAGTPKSLLTDNMSSIVDTKELKFNKEFKAFAKDMGIDINKCKVNHPFTKGKVEVRNKFIKWLIPYNYEFETEEDIIKIIEKINIQVNNQINDTTGMKPILLYSKEKEYLQPLPSITILEHYMNLSVSVKVQNTSLINYKGSEYSVPPKYINRTLKVKELDNKLHIYDNTELIITHDISNKKINYKEEHYVAGLKSSMPDKSDEYIDNLAKRNLQLFNEIANLK